ncbi:MAG: response regulator transcription factor [Streptosporangiaceae bacterium]|jgi:DNA-binding response OmpR family regulator
MAEPAASAGPASVLLAEHEPAVAEMSARYLRADGLLVRLVTTPETALAELTHGPDAAAVLDLTMPGLDPRRIRRALRTPVIFLVSGPRPRGLARADARRWLGRPFSPRQLARMVRDVLAPPEQVPPRPAGLSAAGLRLDGPSRTVLAGAEPVPLTATEFAILAAMMDHPGRVLSRRSLLVAAGREAAGDRSADVYIAQLRAKIASAAVIRTVRGAGYALEPVQGGQ